MTSALVLVVLTALMIALHGTETRLSALGRSFGPSHDVRIDHHAGATAAGGLSYRSIPFETSVCVVFLNQQRI